MSEVFVSVVSLFFTNPCLNCPLTSTLAVTLVANSLSSRQPTVRIEIQLNENEAWRRALIVMTCNFNWLPLNCDMTIPKFDVMGSNWSNKD